MEVVYESSECVVCLEDESIQHQPVAVFIPCRHRCCCPDCVTKITEAKLPCPLCRQVIERVRVSAFPDLDQVKSVAPEEVAEFKSERRNDYRKQFLAVFASNAGFVGKGKLARSVGAATMSELQLRQAETRGGEMMVHGNKAQIKRVEDTLVVEYKVGRGKRTVSVPFVELRTALDDLKDQLEGDSITALDVAVHYPEHYWIFRFNGLTADVALAQIDATLKRARVEPKRLV